MVEMLLRAGGVGQLTGRHGMDWTPLMCGYASLPAVRALFEVLEDMTRAGLGADEGAPGAALPPHTDTPAASASQVSGEHTIDVGSTPTSPTAHITPALLLSHTNEQGQTLLHLAALHASADLVRYLLGERRADLVHGSSLEAVLRQRDASSRTPLMLAASGAGYGEDDAQAARRADVVRTLLSAAASGLAPDAARDALRALLLEDRTAPGGRTAPMLAAENGNTEALSMLLTFPAPYDPDLLDEQLLASDAQGMGMPSLALAARHAKPWLRGRADAVLQLLSQLRGSSPTSGSPGTPVLPPGAARPPLAPLVVANPSRAGRQGGTSLETGMPEMDGRGRSASPGAAVGEVPGAPGLRRKGSNGSRVGEE
ncbi:hypothetical protein DFJ74DRAFT_667653 [Hyaloraphidium curvatum]|nr:hypothetical protein DFJ74DRAFT_667653 [Hyaloraphidium curvatum]